MYKIFIVTMTLIVAITPFAMIYWAMKNQRPKRRSYYVNRYDIGDTDGGGSGGGFLPVMAGAMQAMMALAVATAVLAAAVPAAAGVISGATAVEAIAEGVAMAEAIDLPQLTRVQFKLVAA